MRNEEQNIRKCLDSLLNQDYPSKQYEILVVDGQSTDKSHKIVSAYAQKHSLVKLLENPKQSSPSGMNIGIKEAKGEIIIIFGGHSYAAPDFISKSIEALEKTGADCVGGTMKAIGKGFIGNAIAQVLSSPFGVGGARFRYSQKPQHVDTVAYGAYRREVFDKIGLFDEKLRRNQDIELNYRLRRSGGKLFLTPAIKSYYYGPQTVLSFTRQAYNNGYWNIKTFSFTKRALSYRHFTPLVFLLLLIITSVLSVFTITGRYLFASILGIYVAAALLSSVLLASHSGLRFLPLLPFFFLSLHLSYGFGSLMALASYLKRKS